MIPSELLVAVAESAEDLGEFAVHSVTPSALGEVPAFFPGTLEAIELDSQDGKHTVKLSWWLAYSAGEVETQHTLYDMAWRLIAHLEDATTGPDVAFKIEADSFGSVEVGGVSYWGCRFGMEAWP